MKKTGLFNCGILWMFVFLLGSMNGGWAEDAPHPTPMTVPIYRSEWEFNDAKADVEAFANGAKDKVTVQEKEKSLENKGLGFSISERFSGFFEGEITNNCGAVTMLSCIADEKLDGNISYSSTGRAGTFSGGNNEALWQAKWDGSGSFLLAPGRTYSVTGTYLNNCYLGTDTLADVDGCSIYQVKTDKKYGLKDFQIFNPTGGSDGKGAWQALSATPVDVFNGSKLAIRVGKTLNIEWPANQPLLKIDAGTGTALATKKDNDEYAVTTTTLSGTDGLHDLSVECCGEKLTAKIRLVSLDTSGYKGEGGAEYYKEDGGGVNNTVLRNANGYRFRVTLKAESGVSTATLNPIGLRWGVYREADLNNPVAEGNGKETVDLSFPEVATYASVFYIDENANGKPGTVASGLETIVKDFVVKGTNLYPRQLTVKYADSLSTGTSTTVNAAIDGFLSFANDLLQKRTHPEEYRALVNLLRSGNATSYGVTSSSVSIVTTQADFDNLYKNVDANLIIIDYIAPSVSAGAQTSSIRGKCVMPLNPPPNTNYASLVGDSYAHEIGHTFGIPRLLDWGNATCCQNKNTTSSNCTVVDPTDFNKALIMYHSSDRAQPRSYLKLFEASAFQNVPYPFF